MTTVINKKNMLMISSSYNKDFITEIKKIGGKWNPENKTWNVDESKENEVLELIKNIYREEINVLNILKVINEELNLDTREKSIGTRDFYANEKLDYLHSVLELEEFRMYIKLANIMYKLKDKENRLEFVKTIEINENLEDYLDEKNGKYDLEKIIKDYNEYNK